MKKYLKVGQRLRRLRGGTPQKVYAKKIGISYQAYQNYESGKRIPQAQTLYKIAEKESVTVDWLLTGNIRSLQDKAQGKKSEVSLLYEHAEEVEMEIVDRLYRKGFSLPPNVVMVSVGASAEMCNFFKIKGMIEVYLTLLAIDKTSPLYTMIRQVVMISLDGNKTKFEAVKSFLEALDPGEKKQDPDTQPDVEIKDDNL